MYKKVRNKMVTKAHNKELRGAHALFGIAIINKMLTEATDKAAAINKKRQEKSK